MRLQNQAFALSQVKHRYGWLPAALNIVLMSLAGLGVYTYVYASGITTLWLQAALAYGSVGLLVATIQALSPARPVHARPRTRQFIHHHAWIVGSFASIISLFLSLYLHESVAWMATIAGAQAFVIGISAGWWKTVRSFPFSQWSGACLIFLWSFLWALLANLPGGLAEREWWHLLSSVTVRGAVTLAVCATLAALIEMHIKARLQKREIRARWRNIRCEK